MALSKIQSESIDLADNFAGMRFGGTASGNALNDYEEGLFAVTIRVGGTSVSSTADSARYTKVGNLVHVQFTNFSVNFSKGSNTGAVTLDLPFVVNDGNPTGNVRYANFSIDSTTINIVSMGQNGQSAAEFQMFSTSGYLGNMDESNLATTATLYDVSLVYLTS